MLRVSDCVAWLGAAHLRPHSVLGGRRWAGHMPPLASCNPSHRLVASPLLSRESCSGGSCSGGWYTTVWGWQATTKLTSEANYPYTATDGTCPTTLAAGHYGAASWGYVDPAVNIPTVAKIKSALCARGSLAAALYVGPLFQAYTGGVLTVSEGAAGSVNHAIMIVGWDDAKGAWLIRNSWSTAWGVNGERRWLGQPVHDTTVSATTSTV